MVKEIWKDIEGYEGYYKISSIGRVKRVKNVIKNSRGILCIFKSKIKNPNKDRGGYLVVDLYKKNKRENLKIHRLVAQAFIANPDRKFQVNHKNGNKLDNQIANLEWVTEIENKNHAWRTGLMNMYGSKNHYSKLIESEVVDIRQKFKQGLTLNELSELYNMTKASICRIVNRKTWTHI